MNVLLIYPHCPDTFWGFRHALKFVHKKAMSPPLGLLTVAAMLPEEWSLRLIDENVTVLQDKDLAWADSAFIGGMIVQRESAREVIARCKAAGLLVVAGGPLFTIEFEDFDSVDHFVLNEAELTLPSFVDDLERGCAKKTYSSSQFANLEDSPVPLWHLVDFDDYATMDIQYSRGCPFDCEFCNVSSLWGHKPRTKSVTQMITELDTLYELGWRASVFFVDDNFIGHKKNLKNDLLPALIDWQSDKAGLILSAETSINLVDDKKLIQMMVNAGFRMVFIGIETINEDSLAECNKKQNMNRSLVNSVRSLQRVGLQVRGGFVVGFDHDTPEIFRRQADFIQESGIVVALISMLQAIPGSRLHERAEQEGRLLCKITGDNVDGTTNLVPAMGLENLTQGYRSLLWYIYSSAMYHQRLRTYLREYEAPPLIAPRDIEYVLGFFRALYHLGIRDPERRFFWRILFWTLIHFPKSLPQAVTLYITGHHFREICRIHEFNDIPLPDSDPVQQSLGS